MSGTERTLPPLPLAAALKQQQEQLEQQLEAQESQARTGGLFGLGSAALGGWAMGMFG